jgi:hypothetical protein
MFHPPRVSNTTRTIAAVPWLIRWPRLVRHDTTKTARNLPAGALPDSRVLRRTERYLGRNGNPRRVNACSVHARPAPDYRSRQLPEQPDIVWGERVLPNFRDTLQGLCTGYIMVSHEDLAGLHFAHGPKNDFKGQMDFWSGWMNTGAKTVQSGIYMPDLDSSCPQFLSTDYEKAPKTVVLLGTTELFDDTGEKYGEQPNFSKYDCTWYLVERIADNGTTPVAPSLIDALRIRLAAGEACP